MKSFFKVIGIFVLFVAVSIIAATLKEALKRATSNGSPTVERSEQLSTAEIDHLLRKGAEDTASKLPMRIDSSTELTQMIYLEGQIHSGFRLINRKASEIDKNTFINVLRPKLVRSICAEPAFEMIRKRKIYSVHYKYYDLDLEPIATVVINEEDCRQEKL